MALMSSELDLKTLSRLVRAYDSGWLRTTALIVALLCGAALVWAELAGIGGLCVTELDLGLFVALIASLSICLFIIWRLGPSKRVVWPLGFCIAGVFFFSLYYPISSITTLALVLYVILPFALYFPFPKNLSRALAVFALFVLIRFVFFPPESLGQRAASFRDLLLLAFFPVLAAFAISSLAAFRGELDRLAEALRMVTKLNLSYQDYNASLEERTALRERLRISRDIHDIVGYALTNTIMSLRAASLMAVKEPERLPPLLDAARENAESAHAQIREALSALRKKDIREAAGPAVLNRIIRSFKAATGVEVVIDYGAFDWAVDGETAFALSHFIQEGMLNAVSHGGATWIGVDFQEADGTLTLRVRDNGSGAKTVNEGIGISGMRERLAKLGGEIYYSSTVNGFTIELRLPRQTSATAGGA